jgi:hypothetical protein
MAAQDISLFPRYSTKENRATNYTLLVLRLLYEQSPALYEETLGRLLPDAALQTMPRFRQQETLKGSVPDGVISQRSYQVFVETKRHDQFEEVQLRSHLAGLLARAADVRALLALSVFPNGDQAQYTRTFQTWADEIAAKAGERAGAMLVAALSFADVLDALPDLGQETALGRTLQEYEAYLQAEGLLDTWRTLLDVVPITTWPDQMPTHAMYSCPVEGAAFQHRRAAYMGGYLQGRVAYIAPIHGMVRVTPSSAEAATGTVVWRNDGAFDVGLTDTQLAAEGVRRERAGWGQFFDYERHVFVLGDVAPTALVKPTAGGLRTRAYVDLRPLAPLPPDVAVLAAVLVDRRWDRLA